VQAMVQEKMQSGGRYANANSTCRHFATGGLLCISTALADINISLIRCSGIGMQYAAITCCGQHHVVLDGRRNLVIAHLG
jgi:hypothetical protein